MKILIAVDGSERNQKPIIARSTLTPIISSIALRQASCIPTSSHVQQTGTRAGRKPRRRRGGAGRGLDRPGA
jgi:hypothetical protein